MNSTASNPIDLKGIKWTGLTVTQWTGSIAGGGGFIYYNYLDVCSGVLDASNTEGILTPNSAR